jgi:mono/diheme cytochrome c family protein
MRTPVKLTACLGLLLAFTAQSPLRAQSSRMFSAPNFTTADGAQVFQRICQGCHMPDAKGAVGAGKYPALASNPNLKSSTFMAITILGGRGNMPAFGAKHGAGAMFFSPPALGYEQIAAVINYVRTHFGNHYADPISAAQVEALDSAP